MMNDPYLAEREMKLSTEEALASAELSRLRAGSAAPAGERPGGAQAMAAGTGPPKSEGFLDATAPGPSRGELHVGQGLARGKAATCPCPALSGSPLHQLYHDQGKAMDLGTKPAGSMGRYFAHAAGRAISSDEL